MFSVYCLVFLGVWFVRKRNPSGGFLAHSPLLLVIFVTEAWN
nr:MAG TPA: hypothetical protein [Caudoviricetes sp.]